MEEGKETEAFKGVRVKEKRESLLEALKEAVLEMAVIEGALREEEGLRGGLREGGLREGGLREEAIEWRLVVARDFKTAGNRGRGPVSDESKCREGEGEESRLTLSR